LGDAPVPNQDLVLGSGRRTHPAPAQLRLTGGEAKRKNFQHIFLMRASDKIFSIKERKFFLFSFLLTQNAPPLSTLSLASRDRAGGQKFISPRPSFLFARLLGLRPEIFWRDRNRRTVGGTTLSSLFLQYQSFVLVLSFLLLF